MADWSANDDKSRGSQAAAKASPMIKPSRRGLLHKKLGVPQGEKIPASKVSAAKNSSSPALRKEATFAQNFGGK